MTVNDPFGIPQMIGYLAMMASASSYLFKSDRAMNKMLGITNVLWVIHFFLLGALAGAANFFIHIARSIAFLSYKERKRRWVPFGVFIAVYSAAGIYAFKHNYDVLPLLASYAACVGLYLCEGRNTKLIFILVNAFLFLYTVMIFSIGGMISMLVNIIFGVLTLWRMRKDFLLWLFNTPPSQNTAHKPAP